MNILKSLLILCLVLLLNGCGNQDDKDFCIAAEQFGTVKKPTFTIRADNPRWSKTTTEVGVGIELSIETKGNNEIELCHASNGEPHTSEHTQKRTIHPCPLIPGWQTNVGAGFRDDCRPKNNLTKPNYDVINGEKHSLVPLVGENLNEPRATITLPEGRKYRIELSTADDLFPDPDNPIDYFPHSYYSQWDSNTACRDQGPANITIDNTIENTVGNISQLRELDTEGSPYTGLEVKNLNFLITLYPHYFTKNAAGNAPSQTTLAHLVEEDFVDTQSRDNFLAIVNANIDSIRNNQTSDYWDNDCAARDGRGLFFHLGAPQNTLSMFQGGRKNLRTRNPLPQLFDNHTQGEVTHHFFELYDYDTGTSLIEGIAPKGSNTLYFRYADGTNLKNCKDENTPCNDLEIRTQTEEKNHWWGEALNDLSLSRNNKMFKDGNVYVLNPDETTYTYRPENRKLFADSAWPANQEPWGYLVNVTTWKQCKGSQGQYLQGIIVPKGESPPDTLTHCTGSELHSNCEGPSGLIYRVINFDQCAFSGNSSGTNNADATCRTGLYQDIPIPTDDLLMDTRYGGGGTLYLRILDERKVSPPWKSHQNWVNDQTATTPLPYPYYAHGGDCEKDGSNADTCYAPLKSNRGIYTVSIEQLTVTSASTHTAFFTSIIDYFRTLMHGNDGNDGMVKKIYEGVTNDGQYIAFVHGLMLISLILAGFTYGFGLAQITQKDFIHYIIKFSIVAMVITPQSWEFFNSYLFDIFINGFNDLIYIFSTAFSGLVDDATLQSYKFSDASLTTEPNGDPVPLYFEEKLDSTFDFLDITFTLLFAETTHIKLLSLLFLMPAGTLIAIIVYIAIAYFLITAFKVVIMYALAIILVGLLLSVAPIMIPLLLFGITKELFSAWIKHLMHYILQPIFLFMLLAMFNIFFFSTLLAVTHFPVCQGCLWALPKLELLGGENFSLTDICIIPGYQIFGIDSEASMIENSATNVKGLFYALMLLLMSHIFYKFSSWVVQVSGLLTVGGMAVDQEEVYGKGVSESVKGANKAVSTALKGAKLGLKAGKTTAKVPRAGFNAAANKLKR